MDTIRIKDLNDSERAFERVKKIIEKMLSGITISCESMTCDDNSIGFALDTYGGIDYFIKDDVGLKGLASRMSFGTPFNTFTIRSERPGGNKTEEQKRSQQIAGDYIYPYWTVQAYFESKEDLILLSLAIIKTKDLFYELKYNPTVKTRKSNNYFKYIEWSNIPMSKLMIWKPISNISLEELRKHQI